MSNESSDQAKAETAIPKIWNPNVAANLSLIFSPIFGSYIQMLNWRILGEEKFERSTKKWFIASIVIWFLVLLLALTEKGGAALGTLFLFVWYFANAKKQVKYVKSKLNSNYEKKSWMKPALIGLFGTLIYFIAAIILTGVSENRQSINEQPSQSEAINNSQEKSQTVEESEGVKSEFQQAQVSDLPCSFEHPLADAPDIESYLSLSSQEMKSQNIIPSQWRKASFEKGDALYFMQSKDGTTNVSYKVFTMNDKIMCGGVNFSTETKEISVNSDVLKTTIMMVTQDDDLSSRWGQAFSELASSKGNVAGENKYEIKNEAYSMAVTIANLGSGTKLYGIELKNVAEIGCKPSSRATSIEVVQKDGWY